MNKEIRVILYSDYPSSSLNIDLIVENLKGYGFTAEGRGNLIKSLSLSEQEIYNLAKYLSSIYISDISIPVDSPGPSNLSELEIERHKLTGRANVPANFYDGYWLQRILHSLLAKKLGEELNSKYVHLIFTGRLFGTFEDRRYHARVILMGTPSLISTSGLIEAPAKPREYYYVKGRLIQSGMDTAELDNIYKGRFVEYDDPKITSILTSFALQVIFYELTGEAFCDNAVCCLSNSHWQEEVLNAQHEGVLCDKCKALVLK